MTIYRTRTALGVAGMHGGHKKARLFVFSGQINKFGQGVRGIIYFVCHCDATYHHIPSTSIVVDDEVKQNTTSWLEQTKASDVELQLNVSDRQVTALRRWCGVVTRIDRV